MGKVRKGYFSELNKKECFLQTLADVDRLTCIYKRIIELLRLRPHTMQELAEKLNKESGYISARLNELRHEYNAVLDTEKKKLNPKTNKPNTLWELHPRLLGIPQYKLFA